jgi:hypothetical protein
MDPVEGHCAPSGDHVITPAVLILGFATSEWLIVREGKVGVTDPATRANGDHALRLEYPQCTADRCTAGADLETEFSFRLTEDVGEEIAGTNRFRRPNRDFVGRRGAAHRGELIPHRLLAMSTPLLAC